MGVLSTQFGLTTQKLLPTDLHELHQWTESYDLVKSKHLLHHKTVCWSDSQQIEQVELFEYLFLSNRYETMYKRHIVGSLCDGMLYMQYRLVFAYPNSCGVFLTFQTFRVSSAQSARPTRKCSPQKKLLTCINCPLSVSVMFSQSFGWLVDNEASLLD